MRIRLRGDQPTTGDYVTVNGTWYKLSTLVDSNRTGNRWLAVDRNGGRRHLLLYGDRGYTCWSARYGQD